MKRWPVCGLAILVGCAYQPDETSFDDPLPAPPVVLADVPAVDSSRPELVRPAVVRPQPVGPAVGPATLPAPIRIAIPAREIHRPSPAVAAAEPPRSAPPLETVRVVPAPAKKIEEDHYHRDVSVPGDHVLFQLAAGSSQIWLSPDRDTFRDYSDGLRSGNRKAVQTVLDRGLLKFVQAGTKATVLEVEKGCRSVRVETGPLAGMAGWIDEDHLRPEPPPDAAAKAKEVRAKELARQKEVKADKDAKEMETMIRVFGPGARPLPNVQPLPSKKRKD